jgi:hypothetical protein
VTCARALQDPRFGTGVVLTTDKRRETVFYILILPAIMEETLFVPCTRMYDLMRAWNLDHGHRLLLFLENMGFEEVELNAGVGNYMLQEIKTRTLASHADDEFDERILSVIQPFLHVRAFAGKYPSPEHARLFARALRKVQFVSPELI